MGVGAWEHGSVGRTARFLLAVCLTGLTCPTGLTKAAEVNPTARLKVVKTTTLWKSPDGKIGAQQARFSPDGRRLAWFTTGGELLIADLRANNKITKYDYSQFKLSRLTWGSSDRCAVCTRVKDKFGLPVVARLDFGDDDVLGGAAGAHNIAWRANGEHIAFSTKDALRQIELATDKTVKLLDQQKGWRPKGAPAYEDLVFVGDKVAARAAGTMKWWLAEPGKEAVALGELRGLCPDPKRKALYAVPWKAGPVGIPRGAGIVRRHPWHKRLMGKVIVPFDHTSGKPYWLVDIFDATYPTTLRVSADGMVRPCLFSDLEFSVREHGPERALRMAIEAKPLKGGSRNNHDFHSIGG